MNGPKITIEEFRRLLYAHGDAKAKLELAKTDKNAPHWRSEEAAGEAYAAERALWAALGGAPDNGAPSAGASNASTD